MNKWERKRERKAEGEKSSSALSKFAYSSSHPTFNATLFKPDCMHSQGETSCLFALRDCSVRTPPPRLFPAQSWGCFCLLTHAARLINPLHLGDRRRQPRPAESSLLRPPALSSLRYNERWSRPYWIAGVNRREWDSPMHVGRVSFHWARASGTVSQRMAVEPCSVYPGLHSNITAAPTAKSLPIRLPKRGSGTELHCVALVRGTAVEGTAEEL